MEAAKELDIAKEKLTDNEKKLTDTEKKLEDYINKNGHQDIPPSKEYSYLTSEQNRLSARVDSLTLIYKIHLQKEAKLTFKQLLDTVPSLCGLDSFRTSNTQGTLSTYPRNPDKFETWTSFPQEVINFTESHLAQYYDVKSEISADSMKSHQAKNCAGSETEVEFALLQTTWRVLFELLRIMGIESKLSKGVGNKSVILQPDLCWKYFTEHSETWNFRVPIEVKPFWSFLAGVNLSTKYKDDVNNERNDSQTIRAVSQIYGYSSFNYTKYSILTTQHETHFFKRSENSQLVISNPIHISGIYHEGVSIPYFACWLFLLVNSQIDGIYSSPNSTPSAATIPNLDTLLPLKEVYTPKQSLYELRQISDNQIHFSKNQVINKGAVDTVISGKLFQTPMLKFKMYDTFHDSSHIATSQKEALTYEALKELQGIWIPVFYGYFNYHGIVILALEDCGVPITEDEYFAFENMIEQGKSAMSKKGIVHNDLEMRNGIYPNILLKKDCEGDGHRIKFIDIHL